MSASRSTVLKSARSVPEHSWAPRPRFTFLAPELGVAHADRGRLGVEPRLGPLPGAVPDLDHPDVHLQYFRDRVPLAAVGRDRERDHRSGRERRVGPAQDRPLLRRRGPDRDEHQGALRRELEHQKAQGRRAHADRGGLDRGRSHGQSERPGQVKNFVDRKKPVVSITKPRNNARYRSGTDRHRRQGDRQRGGRQRGPVHRQPARHRLPARKFAWTRDVASLSKGKHRIRVRATDTSGNLGWSSIVTVQRT